MPQQKLATYLWTYRKRSGFTQSELAFLVHLAHRTAVSKHECGESQPGLETLLCYEMLFAIGTHDLYEDYARQVRVALEQRARIMLQGLRRKPLNPVADRKILTLRRILEEETLAD